MLSFEEFFRNNLTISIKNLSYNIDNIYFLLRIKNNMFEYLKKNLKFLNV